VGVWDGGGASIVKNIYDTYLPKSGIYSKKGKNVRARVMAQYDVRVSISAYVKIHLG
jgi:hypothetical protein